MYGAEQVFLKKSQNFGSLITSAPWNPIYSPEVWMPGNGAIKFRIQVFQ